MTTAVQRDLRDDYLHAVTTHIEQHPRSLQTTIGPSELGAKCGRKLGHKLNQTPPARTLTPGWRPTVGTAVHTWLADAFHAENTALGWDRWLTETKVWVGDVDDTAINGSADMYDALTHTVIDHKVVGPGSLKKYRTEVNAGRCPDHTYRAQLHLYGRGFTLLGSGLPVDRVMIVFLPSAGELADTVIWSEPYDEQVALDALSRADGVAAALRLLGPAVVLPQLGTVEDRCPHCPWFVPGAVDLAVACPGAASMYAQQMDMNDLVPS